MAHGKSLKESAKRRTPKGIKEAAEKINWQTGSETSKSKRRGVPRNRRRRHNTTSLHENGLCSRTVVRMSQVGAGSVFGAADADQRGEWQLDRIPSVDVGG